MKKGSGIVLEGRAAVRGALLGEVRQIEEILMTREKVDRFTTWLQAEAERRDVPLRRVESSEIDRQAPSRSHGGIIAVAGERRYLPADQLPEGENRLVVMLDGIEDPYNLGFAVRTLWAAGVDGVVLRNRTWGPAEGTILRSSAGTFDLMPIATVDRPEDAAAVFRRTGMRIAATARDRSSISLYEADLRGPTFLLVGGERRGVTRAFLDRSDLVIHIPYGREFDGSLGAASAAAVIGFEAMRQRRT